MDAEERIKQKVKSATEIHDYTVIFFDKIRHAEDEGKARKEWFEVCGKKEWINVKEVLQILAEQKQNHKLPRTCKKLNFKIDYLEAEIANIKEVEKVKWRELLKLRKNRPKIKTDESFDGMMRVFYDRTEVAQWFKKFGELTEEEKLKDLDK